MSGKRQRNAVKKAGRRRTADGPPWLAIGIGIALAAVAAVVLVVVSGSNKPGTNASANTVDGGCRARATSKAALTTTLTWLST